MTKQNRICQVCEAACGLSITTEGRQVVEIRANKEDVFSSGHMCPKGVALMELDADPDRLRYPLILRDGQHIRASWDEAFELIRTRLNGIRESCGPDSVAVYIGNPTAHNVGLGMGLGVFSSALGSRNIYSAGSVDQLPKQLACELMFGDGMAIPVPDIERCDYLLMLGANPIVSNGSLWVVPKFREKLRAFHQRGGMLVTVDPRRSETAKLADHHHFIRPGTDAWLLGAVINELLAQGMRIPHGYDVKGQEELFRRLEAISMETAAIRTGIAIGDIKEIAHQLKSAGHAAVYGRVGTTLQAHGTLTSFLVEVVNILTGNLDSEGGAMFPEQPFSMPLTAKQGLDYNRYQSRVSAYPEVLGQMPTACLAEEIETEGDGQIKALVTFAGNPVVSNQGSERLSRAISSLDFMVSVDIYHNETTRLADVILPGTSPFEDGHYDHFLGAMGYRNSARYSPPVFTHMDRPSEWTLSISLAYIISHNKVPNSSELADYEDDIVAASAMAYTQDADGPLLDRDVQELVASIGPEKGVERLLDLGIRAGRWGDHFEKRDGLTLQGLIDAPNGIDLGPPRSRMSEVVRTVDGRIDLAPEVILEDINYLTDSQDPGGLLLIGRRNIQTNNSWMHNLPRLDRGSGKAKTLCFLEINPVDAQRDGLQSDDWVEVTSTAGSIVAQISLSESISPGVISLPHGFSHDKQIRQSVTKSHQGPNYNVLAPTEYIDRPSATASLNGIPVTIRKASDDSV